MYVIEYLIIYVQFRYIELLLDDMILTLRFLYMATAVPKCLVPRPWVHVDSHLCYKVGVGNPGRPS